MAKSTVRKTKTNDAAVRREFARLAEKLASHDKVEGESRRERGLRTLTEIVGVQGGRVLTELVDFSPELTRFIVDHAYGDVISRKELDGRTRALVVVAALAALGNAGAQLRTHIGSALNSGCTREEILETLLVTGVYAGFPAALNGMAVAREALAETPRRREGTKRGKRPAGKRGR